MRQFGALIQNAILKRAVDYWKITKILYGVILSGAAQQAFPCHPERSGVAAQSKDLYSDFVDIFIEIPRQARDDGAHSSAALGMKKQRHGGRKIFPPALFQNNFSFSVSNSASSCV